MVIGNTEPRQHLGALGGAACTGGRLYDAAMWRLPRLQGLHLARVLTAPDARVIERSNGRSVVAIDGLVCAFCAARTRRALSGVRGVGAAEVDLARGLATIEHAGAAPGDQSPDDAALLRALEGVVVAPGLRRRLAAFAARRGRHRRREARRSPV